jgi:EAL domain-containing protein (putative c-di-GMP-specific phosphodiesterase class I)/DNA-binding response OmpR family regulator
MTAGPTPQQGTVLVADDDQALRTLFGIALRRAGMLTVEAASGEEALEILDSQAIDVLVVDLLMSGMSGLDVINKLRSEASTRTLPILLMTGSGDAESVIEVLAAGADDFLAKPIRLEELVARVGAHLRKHNAWTTALESELKTRANAVQAIGQLAISSSPEEAAEAVVAELSSRTGARFVGVLQLAAGDRLKPLARFNFQEGITRGGQPLSVQRTGDLLARARGGPFSQRVPRPLPNEPMDPFWTANVGLVAGAPIFWSNELVGILTIGLSTEDAGPSTSTVQANLLASVIDYANVLSAVAGRAIADRRHTQQEKDELSHVLTSHAFFPVYQPILDFAVGQHIGFEALTRFEDQTPPDVRFAEARSAGLGSAFELAAIGAAIDGSTSLPAEAWLSLNVSPDVVLTSGRQLRDALSGSERKIVLEITEHAEIADYPEFRRAFQQLGDVALAIDDAGAGYASLRHILELGPDFAKLDRTLVQNVDADMVRQALIAGLGHFAGQTGFRLIAEGVERQAEADVLPSLGVELAQGYLFGRPEPRNALES